MSTTIQAINDATAKLLDAINNLREPKVYALKRFRINANSSATVNLHDDPRYPEHQIDVTGYRKACILITENWTADQTCPFEYDLNMGIICTNQYRSTNSMYEKVVQHRQADGKIHTYDIRGPDIEISIYNTAATDKTARFMLYLMP